MKRLAWAASAPLVVSVILAAIVAGPLRADPPKDPLAERTFESEKWGIKCVRPDDPTWVFATESEWSKLFTDARQLDNMAFILFKMKSKEGKVGHDMPQVEIFARSFPADARFDFDGKTVEASSLKGFAKAMFTSTKGDYKDIKDEKELGEVAGYSFAPRILMFSFRGVNKQDGGARWIQNFFFKSNGKVYAMIIAVPAGDEKTFSKDIDKVMKGITLFEAKKGK